MKGNMKVSFIIPVYKVEAFLNQCVDSIIAQTYRDIEVILVDDGSPDRCPEMCDALAKKDSRIKVLHKPNGGLSDARNTGLKAATGDYVIFVDGDDFWTDEGQLVKLVNLVEGNPTCDFIGFNCSYYYPDSNTYKPWPTYSEAILRPTSGNDILQTLVKSGTVPMSACMKIIKRSFLLDNALFFEVGILAEDIPWFINVLEKCEECMFINQYVYAYRQNVSGSITHSGGERSFKNLFAIVRKELELIAGRRFDEAAKNSLYSFIAYEYCILLSMVDGLQDTKTKRKELYSYKWLLRYTDNPKVKMANMVCRIFGIRVTEWVLRMYNNKRKSQN